MTEHKFIYVREIELKYGKRNKLPIAGGSRKISSSLDVVPLVRELIDRPYETFLALFLGSHNDVLGYGAWAGGGPAVAVHPADIFQRAILANAQALILAHNHPSGSAAPSQADVELTKAVKAAGSLLGIRVLDHLIVTERDYYSFLDAGAL